MNCDFSKLVIPECLNRGSKVSVFRPAKTEATRFRERDGIIGFPLRDCGNDKITVCAFVEYNLSSANFPSPSGRGLGEGKGQD